MTKEKSAQVGDVLEDLKRYRARDRKLRALKYEFDRAAHLVEQRSMQLKDAKKILADIESDILKLIADGTVEPDESKASEKSDALAKRD